MSASIEAWVEEAAAAFFRNPKLEDDALVSGLIAFGADPLTAERIVQFLPIAFGRLFLEPYSPNFNNEFLLRNLESGREARGRFTEDSIFQACLAVGRNRSRDDLSVVARISAEVNAIEKLIAEGSNPGDVVYTELVFVTHEPL